MKTRRTRLVAVGACSIDTILTVPYFPEEDSKLRATSFIRRRGGNCPNTLEVLVQLLQLDDRTDVDLHLVATLPTATSRDVDFIAKSFDYAPAPHNKKHEGDQCSNTLSTKVDLNHCLYREDFSEPVSSYIISSRATTSRTIINHNALPEMTYEEFVSITEALLRSQDSSTHTEADFDEQLWFHFEGRIPETTLQCIRHLRSNLSLKNKIPSLKISVELEKPGREGLQELAYEADVLFYSRNWAEGEGYSSAETCLREQALVIRSNAPSSNASGARDRLLICTWGASGACALPLAPTWPDNPATKHSKDMAALEIECSPAYTSLNKPIVDTTGAGDTFIAGVLFGLICKRDFDDPSKSWSIRQTLDFANELAGRKILQQGFRVSSISLASR